MKILKISVLFILGIAMLTSMSSGTKKNKANEDTRSWTFCCTDRSHQTLRSSACVVTSTRYNDYKSCYKRVKSHKKAYPRHGCGCR
ncbi:hypothetical protein ACWGOQ_0009310 [Aquimarina sp. M1]